MARWVLALIAICISVSSGHAAVSSQGSLTLELVQKSGVTPTVMDYGAVWDGSQVTTALASPFAHTLTLRITNNGSDPIDGVSTTLTLPDGFVTLSNTVGGQIGVTDVTSSLSIGALNPATDSQVITLPAGTVLPVGETLTLTIDCYPGSGSSLGTGQSISWSWDDGTGAQSVATTTSVLRSLPGAVLTADASEVAVPNSTTFTVTISNLGAGAAFDVEIDPAASLRAMAGDTTTVGGFALVFDSWIGLPAGATTDANSVVTLPHLGPGDSVSFQLQATAISCGDMSVELEVDDLYARDVSEAPIDSVASVRLRIEEPLLQYTTGPPDLNLSFGAWTSYTVVLENAKDGAATAVTIDTGLESVGGTVEIRFPGPNTDGWNYDSSTGTFALPADTFIAR